MNEFGKWDFRHWPADRMADFWKYFEQYVRFHERDSKVGGGKGAVCVVDFDGFKLTHHASPNGKNGLDYLDGTGFDGIHLIFPNPHSCEASTENVHCIQAAG